MRNQKRNTSILESQSFKKVGAEFGFTIEFNKEDDREYLEIITEIEDALFEIIDKKEHLFISGHSKGLTERELMD